jgi:hypothetical protein
MKKYIFLLICLGITIHSFSQERFLQYSSKDSINGYPKIKGALGVNLKLNGYYDVFGGLQESETFNIGNINIFGTDDSGSLNVDLYQTQVKLESSFISKKGHQFIARVEFDFWGGNGHLRLRQAFVENEHWLVGQTWAPYGDAELWPDILEWEGPPSGIWVRLPMIKYKNFFKNKDWTYTLALTAPITDFVERPELAPFVEEAFQKIPDFTAAFKYQKNWGHLRLSSILRNIQYKIEGEQDDFWGYGAAFSGMYIKNKNNLQFQLTGGKGVSAYNTSVQGNGYDGYANTDGLFEGLPSFGGWISYGYFFTSKLHSTVVVGYTKFFSNGIQRYLIIDEIDHEDIILTGNVHNWHYYGIINLMYDPIERMSFGVELDYGNKKIDYDGYINGLYISNNKARDAMRVSFGIMYFF